jgi:hypothetical protein
MITTQTDGMLLTRKFYYALPNNGSLNIGICNCTQRYAEALQCALIAVDEIIRVIDPDTQFKTWMHYKEIKKEIEKIIKENEQSKCVI